MRAVIYTRISKDDRKGTDEEGLGVARQEAACRDLCQRRGWTVAEVVPENDTSASTRKPRQKFERVLAMAERGEVDVIVAWHIDRLTRRVIELERIIEICERTGAKVATVSGDLDLTTDAGRLVGRILASVARGEVERKGARQRAANQHAVQSGRVLRGRLREFGFTADYLATEPAEAQAIQDACRALLAGGSIRSIVRAWMDAGHVPTGGSGAWSPQAVRGVLGNPRIAGFTTYRGEIVTADGEPVKGAQPAIVGAETWRSVRALLDDPSRRPPAGARSLLSGEALCVCGAAVWAGRSYHGQAIYKCSTYVNGRPRAGEHVSRKADPVNEYVTAIVLERLSRPDARDLLVDRRRPDVDRLRADAAAIDTRLRELAQMVGAGDMTTVDYRIAREAARKRLDEVEAHMADADMADVLGPFLGEEPAAVWEAVDLDRRRAAISRLMRVVLRPPGRGRRSFDPSTVEIVWHV